jgi:archaellum component FlaC
MGLFNFRKREDVVDLTDQSGEFPLPKSKKSLSSSYYQTKSSSQTESDPISVLSSMARGTSETSNSYLESSQDESPRGRLSKHLSDMTEKIEDLSNQIYRLQQRIEMLEQKLRIQSSGY